MGGSNYSKTARVVICQNCGCEFNNFYHKKIIKSCSRKCHSELSGKTKRITFEGRRKIKPTISGCRQVAINNKLSCYICGENRPYLLECHHIDGDRSNNYDFNLMYLCANCHGCMHLICRFKNDKHELFYSNRYLSNDALIEMATGKKNVLEEYYGLQSCINESSLE